MVSATDGSAFTGTVTVYVTGDNGAQALGSVGSGVCIHEGNGYHSYAPAQAETNYDHIAFTFIGTGAVPTTVQLFTEFPQTGDSFARIGATGSGLTSLASQASVDAVDDYIDTEIAAIKAKTDNLPSDPADASDIAAAFSTVNSTLATIAAYIDTEVGAIYSRIGAPTGASIAADIAAAKADTAAILDDTGTSGVVVASASKTGYSLAAAGLDSVVVETGLNARQSLSIIAAATGGVLSGAATTTNVIKGAGVATTRITATVDADGNRSAITLAPPA